MKKSDYSTITTFAELHKAREENESHLSQITHRLKGDAIAIYDSVSSIRLALSFCEKIFSGVSFIARITVLLRSLFSK